MFEITLGNSTEWVCHVDFQMDHLCIPVQLLNCFSKLSLINGVLLWLLLCSWLGMHSRSWLGSRWSHQVASGAAAEYVSV